MCLFNGLAEPSCGEVNLATVTLGLIITQPVLQKRSAATLVSRSRYLAVKRTYLSGAGHRALNRKPSRAWTIASSRVKARTAPLLAV